jgi:hypothetical protein
VRIGGLLFAAALLPVASAAWADDDPICADRPGKANPTCTVPPGDVQIETGLADWTDDNSGGVRTRSLTVGDTAVKFGLTDRLHIEFDLTPYTQMRTRLGASSERSSGIGDSGLALKYRFTRESAPVQAALYPFVKLPTANHSLGNGRVEGGVALLVDSSFGGSGVSWDIAPEVDLAADSSGSGYHVATVQVASIGVGLTDRLSVSGDLWGQWDFDPAGTVRQYSIDGAAAYLVSNRVQLDAGVNLGLNRDTPDIELYSGIAARF